MVNGTLSNRTGVNMLTTEQLDLLNFIKEWGALHASSIPHMKIASAHNLKILVNLKLIKKGENGDYYPC